VPVLDIETSGATAAWIVAFRAQFRLRLRNAGIADMRFRVYSGQGFLVGALAPVGWIDADTTIWAAQYATRLNFSHPALVMWQSTSVAAIAGILGSVDEDQFENGWTPAVDVRGGTTVTTPSANEIVTDLLDWAMVTDNKPAGTSGRQVQDVWADAERVLNLLKGSNGLAGIMGAIAALASQVTSGGVAGTYPVTLTLSGATVATGTLVVGPKQATT
jgi:hypothetical protein